MVGPCQFHPGHCPTRAQRAQVVGGEIMTDGQLNLTYFSPKVEKRTSPIEGRGLFSKANIKKGEDVVVNGGYILTKNQRDEIGIELGPSEIQITADLFIRLIPLSQVDQYLGLAGGVRNRAGFDFFGLDRYARMPVAVLRRRGLRAAVGA